MHFTLQYRILQRRIIKTGVNPLLGLLLSFLLIILFIEYLFYKVEYAPYIVAFFYLYVIQFISSRDRDDFLALSYGDKKSNQFRIIENMLIAIPLSIHLSIRSYFSIALVVLITGILSVYTTSRVTCNVTIPTPFYRRPFEFIIGFRKTIIPIAIFYILTGIGVYVGNLNLALFSIIGLLFLSTTFYSEPENNYFVWSYALTPVNYLRKKMVFGLLNTLLLVAPVAITFITLSPDMTVTLLIILLLGLLFLCLTIVAKYAVFPRRVNLIEGIVMATGLIFPPLLLLLIPYFYKKATHNLIYLLDDNAQ